MLDVNVNFHYLFPVAQSVKLYPLFGLTMSNWMFDMHDLDVDWDGDHDGGNHNEFRIGANLGAGAEFALGRNWAMNVEFRYQLVDDFDQGVINFGAAYRF
ncbi:Opacity protein and related surface antigens [Phocaeicola vulgatus]|nr:Opacity protein and related surface antigens [Phocaeicola vulgatus]